MVDYSKQGDHMAGETPFSAPPVFEAGWDLLTEAERHHYGSAILSERAKILLSMAAVMGACQETPVSSQQVSGLREQLEGRHLSELQDIHDSVQQLGRQLQIRPFVTGITTQSPTPRLPESQPSGVEVAAETEPVPPEPVQRPPESKTVTEDRGARPDESARREETGAETSNALTSRQKHSLQAIFGEEVKPFLDSLSSIEADNILKLHLAQIYKTKNIKKQSAERQIQRWFDYLDGKSDPAIALDEGGVVTASAITQGRYQLYTILRRANPNFSEILKKTRNEQAEYQPTFVEPTTSEPSRQQAQSAPSMAKDPTTETTQKLPEEQLTDEVLIFGDRIGLSYREKHELKRRFNMNEIIPLTAEAQRALGQLAAEFAYAERDGVPFDPTEVRAMRLLAGEGGQGRKPQPAYTIRSIMKDKLEESGSDLNQIFINILSKVNKYKDDRGTASATAAR